MKLPRSWFDTAPEAAWPAELDSLCKYVQTVQPPLLLSAVFQLHAWVSHYAKQFFPEKPLQFVDIWCKVMREDYELPANLCRPFYDVLVGGMPGKQIRDLSASSPPPGYATWEDVEAKLHPTFRALLSTLFGG